MIGKKKLVTLLSCFLVFFLSTTVYCWWLLNQPLPIKHDLSFRVQLGESAYTTINRLTTEHKFRYPLFLKIYTRITRIDRNVQAGEYLITPNDSAVDVMIKLTTGDVILYSVTLLEGKTFEENLEILRNAPKLHNNINNMTATEILSSLNIIEDHHPEGMFFPDTYVFREGETALSILERSYVAMTQLLEEEWSKRESGLPYDNSYDALIMASLVERETGVAIERSTIAGVFVNRLRKRMRLQTDPTVIYGLGDAYKGKLSKKHLNQMTPYNTYRVNGLPPTPISLVGKEALHAALNPEKNDYYYFVAKGDGYHYFSKTLKEHNKAVAKYQLSRRSDYKSYPAKQ